MITELTTRNFKSWKDTGRLQLAPLTGLFGANSSGKTSILQVLLMLKQTVDRPPDWNELLYFGDEASLVNLGSFDNIIHRPADDSTLEMFVSWKLPEKLTIQNIEEVDTLSFLLGISMGTLEAFRYVVRGAHFEVSPEQSNDVDHWYQIIAPTWRDRGRFLFRCYGTRHTPRHTSGVFSDLEKAFENLFSRILYLGPLREHPRHRYTWEGDHPKSIGQEGEKAIPALLSGRIRRLPIDEQILSWLQRLELIHSYDLHPVSDTSRDYEFLVKQYKGGPEVRLTDIGFGVSQVLPVLILCYYAPEGSILILEQPEAHLHPKVQTELADVLIDVVENRNVQIILESHSEYLLSRLQRRIAEKKIAATDTALYFCEIKDGTSEIEQLNVDEYGNIRNWPQDFFGDVTGELIKKTKVEMQAAESDGLMVVADTNVAVVANALSEQASEDCVEACAERLEEIMRGEVKLVLDDDWQILGEYAQNLHSTGTDVGDRFLRWVLRNWRNPERCDLIHITPVNGSENEFEEFPPDPALDGFDRNDRKFIAVACAHSERPPILQAVDSQWWDFRDAFRRNGIIVEFICEDDIQRLREDT